MMEEQSSDIKVNGCIWKKKMKINRVVAQSRFIMSKSISDMLIWLYFSLFQVRQNYWSKSLLWFIWNAIAIVYFKERSEILQQFLPSLFNNHFGETKQTFWTRQFRSITSISEASLTQELLIPPYVRSWCYLSFEFWITQI